MASYEDSAEWMREKVLKAMSHSGLTPSDMANFMRIPLAQFSHQMQRGGKEHLSGWRLPMVENATFWESLLGDLQARFVNPVPRAPEGPNKAVDWVLDLKHRIQAAADAATEASVAANRAYLDLCAELEQRRAS